MKQVEFEAYQTYIAIKCHFTQPSYDYFRYKGKVSKSPKELASSELLGGVIQLAKFRDVKGFLVSNFVKGNVHNWLMDMVKDEECNEIYNNWRKRQQSQIYQLEQDLLIVGDIAKAITVKQSQHPTLLQLLITKEIDADTVIILNELGGFLNHWDKKIADKYVWPQHRDLIKKYKPFITYDLEDCKEKVKEHCGNTIK